MQSAKKLSENLPREHFIRAKNQYEQVCTFNNQILEDVHDLNLANLKLRETLKNNLNTNEKKFGFLQHDINDYFKCIPIVNDN